MDNDAASGMYSGLMPEPKESRNAILREIDAERDRQNELWGGVQQLPDYTYLAIATEELGEAAQAMLHDEFGGDHAGTLRTELVQLAAVIVQWLERMDMEAADHIGLDGDGTGGQG